MNVLVGKYPYLYNKRLNIHAQREINEMMIDL